MINQIACKFTPNCAPSYSNPLTSFGVTPGGYIGYYDPETRSHETYSAPKDKQAQARIKIKTAAQTGRGYVRKNGVATVTPPTEQPLVDMPVAKAKSKSAKKDQPRKAKGGTRAG